jgi:hypothetical protein
MHDLLVRKLRPRETPPSSAFGTFSPRKKTAGGEGLSIRE